MKRDAVKYPNITGRNGQPVDSPSPHTQAAMEADAKAFAAVMGYLKKAGMRTEHLSSYVSGMVTRQIGEGLILDPTRFYCIPR